jgi:hypothetical protein
VAEKPIIFSTSEVRAILEGRKTQTRRVIKPQAPNGYVGDMLEQYCVYPIDEYGTAEPTLIYPPYKPGDVLWVRETWATVSSGIIEYKATYIEPYTGSTEIDHIGKKITWRPSVHMPEEAARIWLKVEDIKVERLQNITPWEAIQEGIESKGNKPCQFGDYEPVWKNYLYPKEPEKWLDSAVDSFRTLWDSINAKHGYGWDINPWVWRIKFKVVND